MYYRNNEQDPNIYESEEITAGNDQQDRHKHTDKYYMEMPYQMQPMSYCPWMETCPMKESCPMLGESKMDPDDPDPRFGRRFHHFHHHFHHHFFHPFFPHFHHHGF